MIAVLGILLLPQKIRESKAKEKLADAGYELAKHTTQALERHETLFRDLREELKAEIIENRRAMQAMHAARERGRGDV